MVHVTSRVESAINFRPELIAEVANPRPAKVISPAQSWNNIGEFLSKICPKIDIFGILSECGPETSLGWPLLI
jgi:hypothetical protein